VIDRYSEATIVGSTPFFIDRDAPTSPPPVDGGRPIASFEARPRFSATRIVRVDGQWTYTDEVFFRFLARPRTIPVDAEGTLAQTVLRYEAEFAENTPVGWTLCACLTPHSNACIALTTIRNAWRKAKRPLPPSVADAKSGLAKLQAVEALSQDWWATSSDDRIAGWSLWEKLAPAGGRIRTYRVRSEAESGFVEGEPRVGGPTGLEPAWCFGLCEDPTTVMNDLAKTDELKGLWESYLRNGLPWRPRVVDTRDLDKQGQHKRHVAKQRSVREELAEEAPRVITLAMRLALCGPFAPWPCDESKSVAKYACVIAERLGPTVAKHNPVLKAARMAAQALKRVESSLRAELGRRGTSPSSVDDLCRCFRSSDPADRERLLRALDAKSPDEPLIRAIIEAWTAVRSTRQDAQRLEDIAAEDEGDAGERDGE